MNQPRFESSETILNKIPANSEVVEEDVAECIARIERPIVEHQYTTEGQIEGEWDGKSILIKYKTVDEKTITSIMEMAIEAGLGNDFPFEGWMEVSLFDIVSSERISLLDTSPTGYRLFFNPQADSDFGLLRVDTREVFIGGGIATFKSILTILHEVGHIWDHKKLDDAGVERLTDEHVHAEKAEKLRGERAASAFALKTLRLITRNPNLRKDAVTFLKLSALRGYYDTAHEKIIKENYMAHVVGRDFDQASMDAEEEELRFYEDFLRWKETPMYKMWRSHTADPDLREEEEYGAWREWLAQSQYNYHRDLPDQEDF